LCFHLPLLEKIRKMALSKIFNLKAFVCLSFFLCAFPLAQGYPLQTGSAECGIQCDIQNEREQQGESDAVGIESLQQAVHSCVHHSRNPESQKVHPSSDGHPSERFLEHPLEKHLLEQLSAGLSSLSAHVLPAVVRIQVQGVCDLDEGGIDRHVLSPLLPPEILREGTMALLSGWGSGFFIDPEGHIVTNAHVVEDACSIEVILHDQQKFMASICGIDPGTDLALLKVEGTSPFSYLTFEKDENIRVGELVVALGHPFSPPMSVTLGTLSGKGRRFGVWSSKDPSASCLEDFIQVDALMGRGSSGGPLVNVQGKVVGVGNMVFGSPSCVTGLAIPSHVASKITDQLKSHGVVVRGSLRLDVEDAPQENHALSVEHQGTEHQVKDLRTGVLVSHVPRGSSAFQAGVMEGDVILAVDGNPLSCTEQFKRNISLRSPGSVVVLDVLRNGEWISDLAVVIDTENAWGEYMPHWLMRLGLIRASTQFDEKGDPFLRLDQVNPLSLADKACLKRGTIISYMILKNGENFVEFPIRSVEDLNKKASPKVDDAEVVTFCARNEDGVPFFTSMRLGFK